MVGLRDAMGGGCWCGIIVAGRGRKSSVSGTYPKPMAFAVDNGNEALYALFMGVFWRPEPGRSKSDRRGCI